MPCSFMIERTGKNHTVRVRADDCPQNQLGVGSIPTNKAGTRDYFVTCNGQRPEGCVMVIRSRVPVTIDNPLPKTAFPFCDGGCEINYECIQVSASLGVGSSLFYCTCFPKAVLKNVRRLKKKRAKPRAQSNNRGHPLGKH